MPVTCVASTGVRVSCRDSPGGRIREVDVRGVVEERHEGHRTRRPATRRWGPRARPRERPRSPTLPVSQFRSSSPALLRVVRERARLAARSTWKPPRLWYGLPSSASAGRPSLTVRANHCRLPGLGAENVTFRSRCVVTSFSTAGGRRHVPLGRDRVLGRRDRTVGGPGLRRERQRKAQQQGGEQHRAGGRTGGRAAGRKITHGGEPGRRRHRAGERSDDGAGRGAAQPSRARGAATVAETLSDPLRTVRTPPFRCCPCLLPSSA